MKNDNCQEHEPERKKRRNLFDFFFLRNKFDTSFAPDLKQQWESMEKNERLKFVLGVIFGFIFFLLSIALLYTLIFNLIPN